MVESRSEAVAHSLRIQRENEYLEGAALLKVDIWLALDRPDRLEVAVALEPGRERDACWECGQFVSVSIGSQSLFEGRVERVRRELDGRVGRACVVVAYSAYHYLRAKKKQARYYQVTDADIATVIAADLELVPIVDCSGGVRTVWKQEGDSLTFLRQRARACGIELAVTAGKLYFVKKAPNIEEEPVIVGPQDAVAVRVVDCGERGRAGRLTLHGHPRWRPLTRFRLVGIGDTPRQYRSVRSLHRVDADGYRTTIEFLEGGLDLAAWQEESP